MNSSLLIVSETFYSIQGEGKSLGIPAVFLRLAGCNLRCQGFSYRDPKTGQHLGCDTKLVWKTGTKMDFDALWRKWSDQNWEIALQKGAHLVITGGEPLLQQPALVDFLQKLDERIHPPIFIEMETNGTRLIQKELLDRIQQFNVSPKLNSSGETRKKAYHSETLATLAASEKAVFKFVVSQPEDIHEILSDYVEPFQLAPQRIWLMPEGGTQAAIHSKAPWIVELCKKHLFNYTPRAHIDIWGETTGV